MIYKGTRKLIIPFNTGHEDGHTEHYIEITGTRGTFQTPEYGAVYDPLSYEKELQYYYWIIIPRQVPNGTNLVLELQIDTKETVKEGWMDEVTIKQEKYTELEDSMNDNYIYEVYEGYDEDNSKRYMGIQNLTLGMALDKVLLWFLE